MIDPVDADSGSRGEIEVLVVDDLPAFRDAASAVIDFTPGFRLAGQASSGEDAIDFVTHHGPDLVLLDVRMPEMDGVTTARAIARICRATVTVLVSAEQHDDIAADPGAYGADAFLPKEKVLPHSLRQLWAARDTRVVDRR